ncbi:glycolate oxidase subunit GlcE [Thiocapsa imhoffii]|uniref:Glycolate oxidase subunit GlcE n=1 Tax=Thiocapsa imhoffii TaxID=382777 RepID=A0A9X0WFU5_9GAMM|nr:glycolate oxidase subunit GlcE [Thiocapsa imhoffii]
MVSNDQTAELQARVRAAGEAGISLCVQGNATKTWLGRAPEGEPVVVSEHSGVLSYEPQELVIRARCGTPLQEIEAILAERGQMLAFEPPHFAIPSPGAVATPGATLGGTIAAGLSGPRRAAAGSARDFVLGTRVLTGRGEVLRFGGEVMKNVAGYDVSRLMTGALGTLGILLDISLKVLPIPPLTRTLRRECSLSQALALMSDWAARPLPISATCHVGEQLWVRLAGNEAGVVAAAKSLGGNALDDEVAARFWSDQVRDQRHVFFAGHEPLWRLSLPAAAPPVFPLDAQLIEWGGAQRWVRSAIHPEVMRAQVAAVGGHATLFRGGDRRSEVFQPLPSALMELHREVKHAFDPQGILNRGRLYATL